MGGSIPKEKYIKICSSYFPLFRRKMLHFTREKNTLMVLNADHQRYKKLHMVTEYHYYHCHTHRL